MSDNPAEVLKGHAALGGAQVLFGLFPIVGTLAFGVGGVDPLGLGAWRIVAGALVLGLISLTLFGAKALPARADLPRAFACAILGVALNQGLFLSGLALSTPMNAGIVICLIPVFTYTFAVLLKQEALAAGRGLGILVALLGTLPLVFPDGLSGLGEHGLGNLLMVGNAASYSLYLVLGKPLLKRYPPLAVTAWAYLGSLVAVPLFAWNARLLPSSTSAWMAVAYVVIGPTILGYGANLFALARVPASTTAIWIYVQPLISALAAWWVFSEHPSPNMLLAALGLFVGMGLITRR